MAAAQGESKNVDTFSVGAQHYEEAIERSLTRVPDRQPRAAYPASPSRRMDAGAIGSIITSYPLQLCEPCDEKLLGTVEFLLSNCFYKDGFFQDMIHSGVNAYLTLHVAQTLLRADDPRYASLIRAVASIASPTGHWPEAVHPRTSGGCMGDGQHAWAAAEWVAMMRNCFIREEGQRLILASGVWPEWLNSNQVLEFGPVPTQSGLISVTITPLSESIQTCEESGDLPASRYCVSWEAIWHRQSPEISVQLPEFNQITLSEGHTENFVNCKRIVA